MLKYFFKTALVIPVAVFLSTSNVWAKDASEQCFLDFQKVQETYSKSNIEATIIDSDPTRMQPYALVHVNSNNSEYVTWKALNGEISGYALRNDKGFDYNQNRSFIGALSWHQSLIWDKLFRTTTKTKGYECTVMGKTRLAGRKVSVIKLAPIDDVRYSFLVSKDDDTNLPVELSVLNPSQIIVAKFTITSVHSTSNNVNYPNETFDGVEQFSPKRENNISQWSELTIPANFSLEYSGTQKVNSDKEVSYQSFSDGIIEFRVYKNSPSKISIPSATDGTLTVLRKSSKDYEYAVVGEIPLELSNLVLSKITIDK